MKAKKNIIFVCYRCLKEIKIPNKKFDPWAPTGYKPAKDWHIPSTIKQVTTDNGPWGTPDTKLVDIPSSNIEAYCPDCKEKK
jgi:hypothetical protein